MEQGLREVCRSVRIGKILIQRVRAILDAFLASRVHTLGFADVSSQDEETTQPKLFYAKVRAARDQAFCHLD
jgi:uracil phosphoribosyltransferase